MNTQYPRTGNHGGRVTLVGAGPGRADLITVRGLDALRLADVVIYDRLIDLALLDEAPEHAERIDAGKSPGRHTLTQEQIHGLIVARALDGKRVVRLKGGDPFVFGRGWEELQACRAAGVSCEVVPGVTSAIAVPAAAGIPVTARGIARSFAVVTPQSDTESARTTAAPEPLDYAALAAMDTLSVLMGRAMLAEVTAGLVLAGRAPSTPAALIADGTRPTQRTVVGTLGTIAVLADEAELPSPAVLVVGTTAAFAESSLDVCVGSSGRLAGRRVVVTRPHSASPPLVAMLRTDGATVIDSPLIRIEYRTPPDLSPLDRPNDWTVFTSLHAVRGLWRVLSATSRDARALAPGQIAAVGPKTAAELLKIGITPDVVPDVHRASALVESLLSSGGESVLFPCGTLARDELRSGLRQGGMRVEELVVYDTVPEAPTSRARYAVSMGVDAVLFYSPSAVQSAAVAGLDFGDALVACIGPTTAQAAVRAGYHPSVVPEAHTDAGLVEALCAAFAARLELSEVTP